MNEAFDIAQIICDVIDIRMDIKYNSYVMLQIDCGKPTLSFLEKEREVVSISQKVVDSFVLLFEISESLILCESNHCSTRNHWDLSDVSIRTRFLSQVEAYA